MAARKPEEKNEGAANAPETQGPSAQEQENDGAPGGGDDEKKDPPATPEPEGEPDAQGVRVVCTRQNPAKSLVARSDGGLVYFACVALEEGQEPVHISELLDPATVERLCDKIGGYKRWAGNEAKYARKIEDALQLSRREEAPASGGMSAQDRELAVQLEEQRTANRNLAKTLANERERIAALEKQNKLLKEQVEAARAAGFKLEGK